MTPSNRENLFVALLAFGTLRTPTRITYGLRTNGRASVYEAGDDLADTVVAEIRAKAEEMHQDGIGAVLYGDDDFPVALVHDDKPLMPIIFYRGNKELLYADGVGMCGSRNVSAQGLAAADRCGVAVSRHQLTIISGYAKGVDTATHLAALRSGGKTVIVLAEGIDFFRVKREFAADFDFERTLVLSQFAPTQTWQAHAAMARNAIIYGLSRALVVIEAGERGGTLAAGVGAMKIGRPVFVVDFGDRTPEGNRILLGQGAKPVNSPKSLQEALDGVSTSPSGPSDVPLF